jgi:formylglycine-generating enzyme required for sulfatase activity
MKTTSSVQDQATGKHLCYWLVLAAALWAATSLIGADEAPSPASATATVPAKADELLKLFKDEQDVTNSLGMILVWVPGGHRVGKFEVTQAEYEKIMGENPSRFPGGQRPVEKVSWTSARDFCQKLTEQEIKEGKLPKSFAYALPTEKEWESYVADAALKDAITSQLGDRKNTENVGGLGPNKLGLHDVRGNVWEWCSTPVARGASWRSFEDYVAVNFRYAGSADLQYDDIGFRVVLHGTEATAK